MYELIIDGKQIAEHEHLKPLIEQMNYYAMCEGFEFATIQKVIF